MSYSRNKENLVLLLDAVLSAIRGNMIVFVSHPEEHEEFFYQARKICEGWDVTRSKPHVKVLEMEGGGNILFRPVRDVEPYFTVMNRRGPRT